MTEEVLIELESDPPPQGSLDLSPLGKTLVVALLNEEAYTLDKQAGRHLNPVQASSTVTAAYLYRPTIKLKPNFSAEVPTLELNKDEKEGDKYKTDQIQLTDLLPEVTEDQEVPYWIDCEKHDLVKHFTPSAITDLMQPATKDKKNKHLGVLTRLRVARATYGDWVDKLNHDELSSTTDVTGQKPIMVKKLDEEKAMLEENLKLVREKLVKLLESYRVIIRGNAVQLGEEDEDIYELINAMGAKDASEQEVQEYGKLLVLKRQYDRLLDAVK